MVIGSGVNIASAPAGTPYPCDRAAPRAFRRSPRSTCWRAISASLDGWLARWRAGGFAAVRPAWLALGSGIGDRVRLRLGREEVAGRFLDVTDQGALLVAQDGDRRRQITAGELPLAGSLHHGSWNSARDRRRQHQHRVRAVPGADALGQWRISTNRERTADEYAAALIQLMALKGYCARGRRRCRDLLRGAAGGDPLRWMSRDFFGCRPPVVGEDLGVPDPGQLIDNPREVGADRVVNAVAAHARYPPPLIIVDFGTATTFDVIDEGGATAAA